MCGIAGLVHFDRPPACRHDLLRAMTGTLRDRGPDAEGLWFGPHVALGHRRLAVIDPEYGQQPMVAEPATITFSGEVYNFRELRAELTALGHRFRTACDTEVVLRGYLEWGDAVAERLNGMYAFGIWDVAAERLLLVRDRMGVKPLYYRPLPAGVVFGSKPKAVLAHPSVPRRVGAEELCEALDMVKTPETTVFAGVREVRPGGIVTVDRRGLRTGRYWRLTAAEHTDSPAATVAAVRDLLADTVSRQLVSDVPLGLLLSGGLDSSAVTALAARSGPVRSFSVGFIEDAGRFAPDAVRQAPDGPFVRDLAEHVGAQHTEILLDSGELAAPGARSAVLRATDAPPAYWGDMWPSLLLFFRAVREHCTVALSGEAADELFGGYRWFRNPAAVGAATFPWLTSGSSRYFSGRALLDRGLLDKLDLDGYRADRYRDALAEVPVLPGEPEQDRRMREITYLNLTRFVQTLLDRMDRMSMANGLEVRVPFCDHRLVEYVFNVPWAMKSFDGREKSLLRAAVGDLLPKSVRERVKTPYPATQDEAYEAVLRTRLADLLGEGDAPVLPLLDRARACAEAAREPGSVSRSYDRGNLELVLWLNDWLVEYGVTLDL